MKRHTTIGILLFLLLLAGLLRLPHLDTSHAVAGDESMWGNATNNALKHPLFILNASHHLPPHKVYADTEYRLYNRSSAYPLLIARPVALMGPDLFSLRIVACLSGILLVPLLFLLVRRTHGDLPAIAAALVMATLPAAVFFSRMAFNEALVALIGYGAVALAMREQKALRAWMALLCGFLIGYGYLIKAFEVLVIVLPAFGIIFLLHLGWKQFRWFLTTAAAFLIVISVPTLLRLVFTPWAVGPGLETLWFDDAYNWKQPYTFYFQYLVGEFSLILPLTVVGLFAAVRDLVTGKNRYSAIWLAIAAMILVISLPSTKKITYFYILLPAWAALTGIGVNEILSFRKRSVAEKAGILTIALLAGGSALYFSLEPVLNIGSYFLLSRQFVDNWWFAGSALVLVLVLTAVVAGLFKQHVSWLPKRSCLIAIAVIAAAMTAGAMHENFDEIDDLRNKSQRSFEPKAIARLQEAVINRWKDRNILVGQRSHSAAVRFHNGTRWPVPYLLYSNEDHLERMLIGVRHNRYVFFVNSHDLLFNIYEEKNGLGRTISDLQQRAYSVLSRKFDDATDWFRSRFQLDASAFVYCLAHVDPRVLDEALVGQ